MAFLCDGFIFHFDICTSGVDQIFQIESGIYKELCLKISGVSETLLEAARWIGQIDVFASFANIARRFDYVRPVVNEKKNIQIVNTISWEAATILIKGNK